MRLDQLPSTHSSGRLASYTVNIVVGSLERGLYSANPTNIPLTDGYSNVNAAGPYFNERPI